MSECRYCPSLIIYTSMYTCMYVLVILQKEVSTVLCVEKLTVFVTQHEKIGLLCTQNLTTFLGFTLE